MGMNSTRLRRLLAPFGFVLAGAALVAVALAQDFRQAGSTANRSGLSQAQVGQVAPATTWMNAGRAFLRWWDPIVVLGNETDNNSPGASVNSGTWINPAPLATPNPQYILAGGYIQSVVGTAPYLYANTVASNNAADPTSGATAVYQWVISGLQPGLEYEVSVNVPIGPTNTQPALPISATNPLVFQQRYWVYRVLDAAGTENRILDSFQGGGYIRFGEAENKTYQADVFGNITVQLFNTVPRNPDGSFIDPQARPTQELVYADIVKAEARPVNAGAIAATPVVGELLSPAPGGGPIVFQQRVVSARNESAVNSVTGARTNMGVVSSFTHNGVLADPANANRRNMVWSWPVRRPFDLTQAETDAYAIRRQAWVGPRSFQNIQVDNLSAGASNVGFTVDTVAGSLGPNFLSSFTTTSTTPTAAVTFGTFLPDDSYTVQIHVPTGIPALNRAQGARIEILRGAAVIDAINFNTAAASGWVSLPAPSTGTYAHSSAAPISVRITNSTSLATDVSGNRIIAADAVRFVRRADLGVTSTPIFANLPVNVGGVVADRDVVIVALNNGKIYCVDAHGDPATGNPPQVFWTYPSDVAPDPNAAASEDGGIAEMPVGFDTSSGFVQRTSPTSAVLVIGASNGRVYNIDVVGRGDGTTSRNWTFPNDYDPTNPTAQMPASGLGPIRGSVTLNGTQVLIPTSAGRIFNVDLAGTPATKSTATVWQFPVVTDPPLGAITTTPVQTGTSVYFVAPPSTVSTDHQVWSLDAASGTVNWNRTERSPGVGFGRLRSTPLWLPAGFAGTGVDTLYFVGSDDFITAVNSATGATVWEAQEAFGGSVAQLGFTYLRTFDPGGLLQNAIPTVLVAGTRGNLYGFYADGSTTSTGSHRNWRYQLEGDRQVSGFATGGWPNDAILPLANRSHLFIGDSDGILYAFSSVDDDGSTPPITPGRRPGREETADNDPDAGDLLINRDDIILISPDDFRTIQAQALAGTVDFVADIQPIFSAREITRRNFEFGENLYVLIRNLPTTGTLNYSAEVRVFGGTTRNRGGLQAQVRNSTNGTPNREGFAFVQVPVTTAGAASTVPGPVNVNARLRLLTSRGNSGPETRINDSVNTPVVGDIVLAHPLGLGFGAGVTLSEAGVTTDPTAATVLGNSPVGLSAGNPMPNSRWLNSTAFFPGTFFTATSGVLADPVSHGSSGDLTMRVFDRSLTTLLFGPTRGLNNVRLAAEDQQFQQSSAPSTWTPDSTDFAFPFSADPVTQVGLFNPLNQGSNKAAWIYRNFEDYPYTSPNLSLDYPDLTKAALSGTKSEFGQVQNPYFQNVDLLAPTITTAARDNYNTFAGYNTGLIGRTLTNTPMTLTVNVPRYHPFVQNPYLGAQFIYVDNGNLVRDDNDAQRTFNVGTRVALDTNLATSTPTLDLGSQPTGAGFTGTGGPGRPNRAGSNFTPQNSFFTTGRSAMFQPFTVLNEGNVNLLSVRVAKSFNNNGDSSRNMELFSPGLHELAWLDGAFNMVTDLDPAIATTARSGLDAQGRMILQKPRSGDVAPTRLSTNPRTRPNPNLRIGTRNLVDPAAFPEGDPRLGVATPIGTPSGSYQRKIFVIEDVPGGNPEPNVPRLNLPGSSFALDPFTDPGITLRFTVREARLTNGPTLKAAPNVDNILAGLAPGQERFLFSNRQPTAYRERVTGSLYVAWSSNRWQGTGAPWAGTNKPEATMADQETWRIFVAGKAGQGPNTNVTNPSFEQGPLGDLSAPPVSGADRWFNRTLSFPYGSQVSFNSLFGVQAGETLAPEASARFHSPAFPTHGDSAPMIAAASRTAVTGPIQMAFIGETAKTDANGEVVRVNRLMVATLNPQPDGGMTLQSINSMPFDENSTKSKPSIVVGETGTLISYTSVSNGVGTLMTVRFDGTWNQVQAMPLGREFENVSAPSLVLRRYQNGGRPIADLNVTAKIRGRQNSEAFQGRLNIRPDTSVAAGRGASGLIPFTNRFDRLELDAATGTYWAPGILWSLSPTDQANLQIVRFDRATGNFVPVANRSLGLTQAVFDGASGEVVFENTLGGKVYLDSRSGSVKFSGAIIPRNLDLYISYIPTLVKTNSGRGANYRSVSAVYDERSIGTFQFPNAGPSFRDRDLAQDLNYTFRSDNTPATAGDPVRHDRLWMAYSRTTADGSSAARPFLKSMRFGVQLPAGVQINANGALTNFQVLGLPAGVFYQVDPVGRKVYFSSRMEDQVVNIRYAAVDGTGNNIPGLVNLTGATVRWIDEVPEEAIPIEQVGNESDISMTLDPDGPLFDNPSSSLRRPPLLWFFWTSNRAGVSDVFFQTLAPATAPVPPNR